MARLRDVLTAALFPCALVAVWSGDVAATSLAPASLLTRPYGTLIAAVIFDRSGTTRIYKYVLNHSFMHPGLISTVVAISTGLLIGKLFF